MTDIPKGLLAGLVATVVLSLLIVMKALMGVMPQRPTCHSSAGSRTS